MSEELFQAIDQHDVRRIAELLSEGADPNAPQADFPQWRPLESAIEELDAGGTTEAVRLLIEHGADVNAWNVGNSLTPLIRAVFHEDVQAIRLLLEAGASPNVVSAEGDSPLRLAVEQDSLEIAALCLEYGARESMDESSGFCGNTVLGLAASKLSLEMIELLIEGGANPEVLDTDDLTAREHLPERVPAISDRWDKAQKLLVRRPS